MVLLRQLLAEALLLYPNGTAPGPACCPSLNAVVNWTPDHWAPDGTKPVQMTADIGGLIAQLTSRPGWRPGNAILVKIEPAIDNAHSGQRIALAYDGNKLLPAVRIVYHTDETIANSIQAYHTDVTAVETARVVAEEEQWSTGEIFLLMVLVAACVGVAMRQYNRKYLLRATYIPRHPPSHPCFGFHF